MSSTNLSVETRGGTTMPALAVSPAELPESELEVALLFFGMFVPASNPGNLPELTDVFLSVFWMICSPPIPGDAFGGLDREYPGTPENMT